MSKAEQDEADSLAQESYLADNSVSVVDRLRNLNQEGCTKVEMEPKDDSSSIIDEPLVSSFELLAKRLDESLEMWKEKQKVPKASCKLEVGKVLNLLTEGVGLLVNKEIEPIPQTFNSQSTQIGISIESTSTRRAAAALTSSEADICAHAFIVPLQSLIGRSWRHFLPLLL
jgi:hypothetical protein